MELISSSSEAPKYYSSYHHSAPTTPKNYSNDAAFYTAPSSPANDHLAANYKNDHFSSSGSDDFEFGTSQRFESYIDLEIGKDFECFVEGLPQQAGLFKVKRERGGSLPAIAFADELFYNGLVMPLKPPPGRFQWGDENASFCRGSIPASSPTRSPQASVFKVPFVHRAAWNDDFDPFKVALDKVSEESRPSRGRDAAAGTRHRRTRSHSPYRTNNSIDNNNFDQQILGPKFGLLPIEPKGSPYARFVIDQKKRVEQSAKNRRKRFLFAKMVRPFKSDPHKGNNSNKITSKIAEHDQGNSSSLVVETSARKIRNILFKYASFGRNSTHWKSNFKKFSFKIKGAADSDQSDKKRRTDHQDSKMEIIEYNRSKPSLALCSHGFELEKVARKDI